MYRVTIDGRAFELRCAGGKLRLRADGAEPDLTVDAGSDTWLAVRQGRRSFDEAIADGDLQVQGPKRSVRNFRTLFAFPPS